ncbi:CPBP family intramembrane glutamic endopeptidase [Bradyrhizobium guangdongense]
METLFVVLVAYGVHIVAGQLILTIILSIPSAMKGLSSDQIGVLWNQPNWQSAGKIASAPVAVAVLWIAIREAGREFSEYLALNWPRPREIMIALGVSVVMFLLKTLIAYAVVGGQEPSTNAYAVGGGAGGLLLMLVAGCIAAPVVEELVVRGFMFRGWSQTFLGPIGTIVLTSILWSVVHPYDWLSRLYIFLDGLALGYFRWRWNSTWLAVIMHSMYNIAFFFLMGPYI